MEVRFDHFADVPEHLAGRTIMINLRDFCDIIGDPDYERWWIDNNLPHPEYMRVRVVGYRLEFDSPETAALFRIRWM